MNIYIYIYVTYPWIRKRVSNNFELNFFKSILGQRVYIASILPPFFFFLLLFFNLDRSPSIPIVRIQMFLHTRVIFLLARSHGFERPNVNDRSKKERKTRQLTRHSAWRLSFLRRQLIEISSLLASFLLILIFREHPPSAIYIFTFKITFAFRAICNSDSRPSNARIIIMISPNSFHRYLLIPRPNFIL